MRAVASRGGATADRCTCRCGLALMEKRPRDHQTKLAPSPDEPAGSLVQTPGPRRNSTRGTHVMACAERPAARTPRHGKYKMFYRVCGVCRHVRTEAPAGRPVGAPTAASSWAPDELLVPSEGASERGIHGEPECTSASATGPAGALSGDRAYLDATSTALTSCQSLR